MSKKYLIPSTSGKAEETTKLQVEDSKDIPQVINPSSKNIHPALHLENQGTDKTSQLHNFSRPSTPQYSSKPSISNKPPLEPRNSYFPPKIVHPSSDKIVDPMNETNNRSMPLTIFSESLSKHSPPMMTSKIPEIRPPSLNKAPITNVLNRYLVPNTNIPEGFPPQPIVPEQSNFGCPPPPPLRKYDQKGPSSNPIKPLDNRILPPPPLPGKLFEMGQGFKTLGTQNHNIISIIKPRKDLFQTLQDENCEYCKQNQPDYLSPCKHYYHINCLFSLANENSACVKCREPFNFTFFQKPDKNLCQICKNTLNLCACDTCQKKLCYFCICTQRQSKEIDDCCNHTLLKSKEISVKCPGCEKNRWFGDIVPIPCDIHNLLCKMCWNLNINLGRCILGCQLAANLGDYIECSLCGETEIKYYGDFICPQRCSVCNECQMRTLIFTSYKDPACPSCYSQLEPKTTKWEL